MTEHDATFIEKMSVRDQLLISKMKDILAVAIQDVDLSTEMKEILSPYVNFEGSEHDTIYATLGSADQELIANGYKLINAAADGNIIELQKILDDSNVNINFKESIYGHTPLHLASQNGHIDAIKLLVEKGASKTLTNNNGYTAKQVYKMQNITGEHLDTEYEEAISQIIQDIPPPYIPKEEAQDINELEEQYFLQKAKNNLIFDKEKICETFYDLCCSGSKETIIVFAKNFQASLDMNYKNGGFLIAAANHNNEVALEFFYETYPEIYNKYYNNLISAAISNPSTECQIFLDSNHSQIETSGNIDQLDDNF